MYFNALNTKRLQSLYIYISIYPQNALSRLFHAIAYPTILYISIIMCYDQIFFHTLHVYSSICMNSLLKYIEYVNVQIKKKRIQSS